MTKRTVANLVAGVVLASSGVVAGLANPAAAADDSGWNGTRIGTTSDSGWNGTKLVKDGKAKKDGKIKKAVKKDSDSGWNGTRVGTTSDSGWNGT